MTNVMTWCPVSAGAYYHASMVADWQAACGGRSVAVRETARFTSALLTEPPADGPRPRPVRNATTIGA